MIAARDHQFCLRHVAGDQIECLDHQFKTFIRPPLSKGENPMQRVPAAGKIWELWPARKNTVSAQMNVVTPVFVIQDFSITGHQHGHRIGQQKHPRSERPRKTV